MNTIQKLLSEYLAVIDNSKIIKNDLKNDQKQIKKSNEYLAVIDNPKIDTDIENKNLNKEQKIKKLINQISGEGNVKKGGSSKKIVGLKAIEEIQSNTDLFKGYLLELKNTSQVYGEGQLHQFFSSENSEF
jgi:hypothetical protein